MCAINDPIGQTHSPASSNHYSRLKVVLFHEILKSGDGQTTRAKIVIITGRDCGLAEWINKLDEFKMTHRATSNIQVVILSCMVPIVKCVLVSGSVFLFFGRTGTMCDNNDQLFGHDLVSQQVRRHQHELPGLM